jgi:hypothetical protein
VKRKYLILLATSVALMANTNDKPLAATAGGQLFFDTYIDNSKDFKTGIGGVSFFYDRELTDTLNIKVQATALGRSKIFDKENRTKVNYFGDNSDTSAVLNELYLGYRGYIKNTNLDAKIGRFTPKNFYLIGEGENYLPFSNSYTGATVSLYNNKMDIRALYAYKMIGYGNGGSDITKAVKFKDRYKDSKGVFVFDVKYQYNPFLSFGLSDSYIDKNSNLFAQTIDYAFYNSKDTLLYIKEQYLRYDDKKDILFKDNNVGGILFGIGRAKYDAFIAYNYIKNPLYYNRLGANPLLTKMDILREKGQNSKKMHNVVVGIDYSFTNYLSSGLKLGNYVGKNNHYQAAEVSTHYTITDDLDTRITAGIVKDKTNNKNSFDLTAKVVYNF